VAVGSKENVRWTWFMKSVMASIQGRLGVKKGRASSAIVEDRGTMGEGKRKGVAGRVDG
jgi:hypothetical protein